MARITLLLFLIILLMLSACHTPRYIYSPPSPNNPFFEHKGDIKISGFYAGTGKNNASKETNEGYDLQMGYAISKNFALTASFFKRNERDIYTLGAENYYNIFDSSVINYQRKLFELGGGYFTAIDKSQTVYFNFYSGVAWGKFSFDDSGVDTGAIYNRFHNSNIFKLYLQPGLNVIAGQYFRFSLLSRISFVHYSGVSTNYNEREIEYFRLNKVANEWIGFIEPGINIQIGVPRCDWMKIEGGLTFCSDPEDNYLEARSFSPYVGVTFDFSKLKKHH